MLLLRHGIATRSVVPHQAEAGVGAALGNLRRPRQPKTAAMDGVNPLPALLPAHGATDRLQRARLLPWYGKIATTLCSVGILTLGLQTLPASTETTYITAYTVSTAPASVLISISTTTVKAGPPTSCATTVTQGTVLTRTLPGYNKTQTEVSTLYLPGKFAAHCPRDCPSFLS